MIHNAPTTIGKVNGQEADASRDLWHWFDAGNPGDVLRLEQGRQYRIDYPVYVDSPDRLFDQNGAGLIRDADPPEPPSWFPNMSFPRNNGMLEMRGTDQLWLCSRPGARIQGPARRVQGKDFGIRYAKGLEAQHAIAFTGTNDSGPATRSAVCVKNIDVGFVGGDLVYFGQNTMDCEVMGDPTRGVGGGATMVQQPDGTHHWVPDGSWLPGLHHCGRQLVAFNGTRNRLYDVAVWRGGRSCFDIEPPGSGSTTTGTRIGPRVRVADYPYTFLAGLGMGQVHDTVIEDVVTNRSIGANFGRPHLAPRHGLAIRNCTGLMRAGSGNCDNPGALFLIYNTDHIEVEGNYQRYQQRRCMAMVRVDGVDITEQHPNNEWVEVP